MNEVQVAQPEQIAATPLPSKRADPLRRWTLVILVLFVLLFGWTLVADRLTPYTSVVSHAKLYIWFGTCHAVWHGGKQHGTGDNG